MKVSDYIVEFLIQKGITDVFGYPGGMVTHLMDSLDKYQTQIQAHVNYHEQACAFAACGYAQIALKPGMAYATSGPGATNLITGICNAYFDSIPVIFITGQVNTFECKKELGVRQKGFQETDIVGIVEKITKYAVYVESPEKILYYLEKAYAIAMEGRKGPVLLDIPMNVQRAEIQPEKLQGYRPEVISTQPLCLGALFEELDRAKRPCLLVGAGLKITGVVEEFRHLAAKLQIPVVCSMLSIDILPEDLEYNYGFIGRRRHR